MIAGAIHKCSDRSSGPFVKVNCAIIPSGLLESEPFGQERGAYTGANARSGRFERAHRGTLVLDEIGDLPLELQPKHLRVMHERRFERFVRPSLLIVFLLISLGVGTLARAAEIVEVTPSARLRADSVPLASGARLVTFFEQLPDEPASANGPPRVAAAGNP
jgi:hypothetical protein